MFPRSGRDADRRDQRGGTLGPPELNPVGRTGFVYLFGTVAVGSVPKRLCARKYGLGSGRRRALGEPPQVIPVPPGAFGLARGGS